MLHPAYAKSPEHYVRAFLVLQKDLQALFDYVEPSDVNLECHSYRIHELLLRACIEVEANCKAIMVENGHALREHANMRDYQRIETSHALSRYEIAIPTWQGAQKVRRPFLNWANDRAEHRLPWYHAYNLTKHNRALNFEQANFEHMLDAVCAVAVLLSAQFHTEDFSNSEALLAAGHSTDGMVTAIGGYFRVKFPDWTEDERYNFDWMQLQGDDDPFSNYNYG
ncbi:TPA: hypothetical protein QDB08_004490 [Burkholderia vietnamiensis]|uniref:hypothetical protein n=1 Tax=Burkholderia vietnamiensis TaxID=60552 RepID=UPI001ABA1FE7|nr:hypothetical protein [Burkholderia vietnamiensis]HDR9011482.1 hypothetical protein [Burkholderia vietnamiensis]HDR9016614.1 hypothetical protein [Burkholderia vietnamiensis]